MCIGHDYVVYGYDCMRTPVLVDLFCEHISSLRHFRTLLSRCSDERRADFYLFLN